MGGFAGRKLFLFEGIPFNNENDGGVNLKMFSASSISKAETINNSMSAVYGSNAMSGIVNFYTYRPLKTEFSGSIKGIGGNYGTFGCDIILSHKHKQLKGFYLNFNTFILKSKGYINTPDSLQNIAFEYISTYLQNINTNMMIGYDFNSKKK